MIYINERKQSIQEFRSVLLDFTEEKFFKEKEYINMIADALSVYMYLLGEINIRPSTKHNKTSIIFEYPLNPNYNLYVSVGITDIIITYIQHGDIFKASADVNNFYDVFREFISNVLAKDKFSSFYQLISPKKTFVLHSQQCQMTWEDQT